MESLKLDSNNFKTDITVLSDKLGSTFETWAVSYLTATLVTIPGLGWLAWPGVSVLLTAVLGGLVHRLVNSLEMKSLFLHTAIRKAESSQRYLAARMTLENLPPTATDAEVENAEKIAMSAFCSLITLTTK